MIIELEEVKEILQISVNTYDALIETLIPIAIGDYLEVRGIPFFRLDTSLTSGSAVIEVLNRMENVCYKDVLESVEDEGVKINGRVKFLDYDEFEITIDSDSTVTDDDIELVVYPGNAQYTLAKIIDWMLNKDNATGYKSETFGTYNYTKFDPVSGLPTDISKMIKAYHKVR